MRAHLETRLEEGRDHDVLVWRLPEPVMVAATTFAGGGVGLRHWIINAQVPPGYGRRDVIAHVEQIAAQLGLRGPGVSMLTAAPVARVTSDEADGLLVQATVGVAHPTWAASDEDMELGAGDQPAPGTINIVAFLPVRLSEGALLNALTTATEAKVQAMLDAGIPGTGTASDALCVVSRVSGLVEDFAGPRSFWGSILARTTHRAVLAGTGRQG